METTEQTLKEAALHYIEKNKNRFLNELVDFLKIPSVSSNPANKQSVAAAAEHLKTQLLKAGAQLAAVEATEGHPVVYAEYMVSTSKPTILIYGHYDVQPAEPLELWESPPFEPRIANGNIYARGACDDKGQLFMHVKSLEFISKQAMPFCNLKFLFEGEEEIGSPSLAAYIEANKTKLACDTVLVSDTAMINNQTPTIIYGVKGITYFDITLSGSQKDLHSGINGGTIDNPIQVLCTLLSKLKDENNKITIPGFYDHIIPPTQKEIMALNNWPFNDDTYMKENGIHKTAGEDGYNTKERIAFRPTLDVNGIWGGHQGPGAKTIIPSKAFAKLSMRLVPGQSAEAISKSFTDYLTSMAPDTVSVQIQQLACCESALSPTDSMAFKAAELALLESFGKKPVLQRIGGSIPVIATFEQLLNAHSILMGFGLDSDNIHSPNEHFGIYNYFKGIESIILFIEKYSQLSLLEEQAPFGN